ncbi:MAG: glycine cleavage system protein R [Hyphomicrobiaceae bacterium]
MTQRLVLTIVAKDAPGIVQVVAEVVAAHEGNWMDSSMVRLGGEFAGIVQISVPEARVTAIEESLVALKDRGLVVTVQTAGGAAPSTSATAHLALSGMDHPGIVRDISTALAACGASIDEMHTELFSGSMTGEKMFSAKAKIVLPADVTIAALRERLETLAQDVMVEIDIQTDT